MPLNSQFFGNLLVSVNQYSCYGIIACSVTVSYFRAVTIVSTQFERLVTVNDWYVMTTLLLTFVNWVKMFQALNIISDGRGKEYFLDTYRYLKRAPIKGKSCPLNGKIEKYKIKRFT